VRNGAGRSILTSFRAVTTAFDHTLLCLIPGRLHRDDEGLPQQARVGVREVWCTTASMQSVGIVVVRKSARKLSAVDSYSRLCCIG
jgi:hypothetical protein